MKKDIHPKYNSEVEVHCDCGAQFTIGSTADKIHTEICYQCNPLYTGEKRIVDTAGRVEKFRQRIEKTKAFKVKKPSKVQKDKKQIKSNKKAK